jgi:DNA-binding transcriptional ArsR family regulator
MTATGRNFGLIDVVVSAGGPPPSPDLWLGPEHRQVLARCQRPVTVVDLASEVDLPIGVIRVLLSDLTEHGIVEVLTAPQGRITSRRLLNAVLDGLEGL